MKCIGCGETYNFDDAAEEFNAYFNGTRDYSYDGWENFCADCAISGQEQMDEEGYEEDIPYCCAACGGDYPNCKTSCKIFDD